MPIDAQLESLLRLVLAGLAAGLLGLERDAAGKPAGTRTFAVVGVGACLFTVASERAFGAAADPVARVAAQVVTGIGFLGAGTIIQVKDRVEGLTTAAGIWAAAAVGVALGYGQYVLGIGATVVLLLTVTVVGRLLPVSLGGERPGTTAGGDRRDERTSGGPAAGGRDGSEGGHATASRRARGPRGTRRQATPERGVARRMSADD